MEVGPVNEMLKQLILSAYQSKKLTESAYIHLSAKPLTTLDEMEAANNELIHFLQYSIYYRLLERIENGERMRYAEPDKAKRDYYGKILNGLYAELDKHMPEYKEVEWKETA